ncbi:MAG: DUF2231 domain-containing protein [Chloroflexi bacterium]|nr:DUF2231 domain-containing protein [Chloroflexota bacterium]
MRATARIKDHPIHPMLVTLPLATGVLAVATDIVYIVTGDAFWARGSFWLITVAILGAIVAAIAGAVDFFTIRSAFTNTRGRYHAILQASGLLVFAANWAVRLPDPSLPGTLLFAGVLLTIVGAAVWSFGAWFGADLVYRRHIGVIPGEDESDQELRRAA